MSRQFGEFVGEVTRVLTSVRSAANALVAASSQVSSASQALSQGTTEQATSVQEITANLEQMNAIINQNAANSSETRRIAVKGAREAEEGGKAVQETVSAMHKIADRVSIIEEIARQTNLLGAQRRHRGGARRRARAGLLGRRQRGAQALRAQPVGAPRRLASSPPRASAIAERSGSLLGELLPSIRKTAELVEEVAAGSNEQATGVQQINRAMSQVDSVHRAERDRRRAARLDRRGDDGPGARPARPRAVVPQGRADRQQPDPGDRPRARSANGAPRRGRRRPSGSARFRIPTFLSGDHGIPAQPLRQYVTFTLMGEEYALAIEQRPRDRRVRTDHRPSRRCRRSCGA